MDLLFFLVKVVMISLTGVMAPGPVTTAAITYGTKSRHAGSLIAIGHGIIEFPLMIAIIAGMGFLFKLSAVKFFIGLIGGSFLLWMGWDILRSLKNMKIENMNSFKGTALKTGIILSATNPYFLLWWATVGLALAQDAQRFGVMAFALFAVLHWLCDLAWLEALSWTSFHGSKLVQDKHLRWVLAICALAIMFFGAMFVYQATGALL